mgnify:CR=1 FL=1
MDLNVLAEVMIATVLILLNVVAIVVTVIIFSKKGWWFFQPQKGTIVFVNKGEDLKEVWVNVGSHKLSEIDDPDGKHWIVNEPEKDKIERARFRGRSMKSFKKVLWSQGIRFIGLLWPHAHVHKFKVDRRRLVEREEGTMEGDASLKKRVVQSPNAGEEVDNLLFVSYRPVYKQGVELAGDNSKINLLVLPTWQLVQPTTPVYYYMGNFYPLLDSAVEAALENFFATHRVAVYKENNKEGEEGEFAHDEYDPSKYDGLEKDEYIKKFKPSPITYSHWIKMRKTSNSALERHLFSYNSTRKYYEKIKKAATTDEGEKILAQLNHLTQDRFTDATTGDTQNNDALEKIQEGLGEGIIPGIGYAMIAFRLVEWEAHGDTKDLAEALQAKQTEKAIALGVIEKARGQREAIILEGKGESERYENLIRVQTGLGVHPDNATITLRETEKASKIGGKDSKITHWFEKSGGGHPPIAISDSPSLPASPQNNEDSDSQTLSEDPQTNEDSDSQTLSEDLQDYDDS